MFKRNVTKTPLCEGTNSDSENGQVHGIKCASLFGCELYLGRKGVRFTVPDFDVPWINAYIPTLQATIYQRASKSGTMYVLHTCINLTTSPP